MRSTLKVSSLSSKFEGVNARGLHLWLDRRTGLFNGVLRGLGYECWAFMDCLLGQIGDQTGDQIGDVKV